MGLNCLAGSILKYIGENYIVIRYGGDEFLILMTDADMKMAHNIVNQINARIIRLKHIKGFISNISVSVGMAYTKDVKKLDVAVKRADGRMYIHKNKLKNCKK